MSFTSYKAMVVRENPDGTFARQIETRTIDDLPPGEVLIRVQYSSLNYKDALSASGHKGVTRKYPHTPGIDAAGVVEDSRHPDFSPGDPVLVTGYDLGQNTSGGYGQYIRVPAEWVIKISGKLTPETAMMLGTAGFTAALGIHHLQFHNITPESGKIIVTGASGGVGSMAVALLSHLGYEVTAVSGKKEAYPMLQELGASDILDREQFRDDESRPLLPGRWAGAIEAVGGNYLSKVIRETKLHGVVTCCGNIASLKVETSIFPFILRGVSLIGIDSANQDRAVRELLWQHLGSDWFTEKIKIPIRKVSLEHLNPEIDTILKGGQLGRVLVDMG